MHFFTSTTYPNTCSEIGGTPLSVPIVLLPGWGFGPQVWQPLLADLQHLADVIVVDIHYSAMPCDVWCELLSAYLSKRCILCGWSLGGMAATHIAALFPQQVAALITFSSNAQFVADEAWPNAMPTETFREFCRSAQENENKTRQRFFSLVAQGDRYRRDQLKHFKTLLTAEVSQFVAPSTASHWLAGLSLLRQFSNKILFEKIHCPALHIFGSNDQLVPASVFECMVELNPHHQWHQIDGAGHCVWSPSDRVVPLLSDFLLEHRGRFSSDTSSEVFSQSVSKDQTI